MRICDEVALWLKSGDGGRGANSHRIQSGRKLFFDGGLGGQGGSVIFKLNANLNSLAHLIKHKTISAQTGKNGSSRLKNAKSGANLIIEVPKHTHAVCLAGYENTQLSAHEIQIDENCTQQMVIKGARGGLGSRVIKSKCQNDDDRLMGQIGGSAQFKIEHYIVGDVFILSHKSSLPDLVDTYNQVFKNKYTTLTNNWKELECLIGHRYNSETYMSTQYVFFGDFKPDMIKHLAYNSNHQKVICYKMADNFITSIRNRLEFQPYNNYVVVDNRLDLEKELSVY